jgi:cytochrome c oxidase subunit 1
MLVTAGSLAWALVRGRLAGDNPWGSRSFEWRTASPPPRENFAEAPPFELGAYDYTRPLEGEGR